MSVQWPAEIHAGPFPSALRVRVTFCRHCFREDIETQGGFPGCAAVEKSPASAGALGYMSSILHNFALTLLWYNFLPLLDPTPNTIFPRLGCLPNTTEMLFAHPFAWNVISQISASITPFIIQVFAQCHPIRKAFLDQPVENTILSPLHACGTLCPNLALFFVMMYITHFLPTSLPQLE